MPDSLTISLLLIIVANLGLIVLYRQLHHDHREQHMHLSALKVMIASLRHDMALDRQGLDDHDEASRKRQAELIGYVQRESKKTRKDIQAIVEEGGRIVSYYADEHSKLKECVIQEGVQTREAVGLEHKVTRQRISQVKNRLADEESDDQKAKAKARMRKH